MTEAKVHLGIDQILKVLDVIIEGGNVAEKVSEAKNVMGKVMALVPLTDELLRLMSLSPMLLKAQYADLDDMEKIKIQDHFKEKFDLDDDALEAKVEIGMTLVGEGVEYINKIVDFAKSLRTKAA